MSGALSAQTCVYSRATVSAILLVLPCAFGGGECATLFLSRGPSRARLRACVRRDAIYALVPRRWRCDPGSIDATEKEIAFESTGTQLRKLCAGPAKAQATETGLSETPAAAPKRCPLIRVCSQRTSAALKL